MLKWSAVLVTSGVLTALAIHYVTGSLEAKAQTAARAELQKLILATQQQSTRASAPPPAYVPPSAESQQVNML